MRLEDSGHRRLSELTGGTIMWCPAGSSAVQHEYAGCLPTDFRAAFVPRVVGVREAHKNALNEGRPAIIIFCFRHSLNILASPIFLVPAFNHVRMLLSCSWQIFWLPRIRKGSLSSNDGTKGFSACSNILYTSVAFYCIEQRRTGKAF